MARPKPFVPVKLVCGVIHGDPRRYEQARARLADRFGKLDNESPPFEFDLTGYYDAEMGGGLKRRFMSFAELFEPQDLAEIKLLTNVLEDEIGRPEEGGGRAVNIDPGYLTASALVMATAKDFSHRIPLRKGIYAHLELLFTRAGVKVLDWTYPDIRREPCLEFFMAVRRELLRQLRAGTPGRSLSPGG
ncbi:MAG: DUF4416 family protein [Candidatus Aminicenantes bacterium]|nr:DUF4416 family protein [Candidatus Aminicenantes bacterium]